MPISNHAASGATILPTITTAGAGGGVGTYTISQSGLTGQLGNPGSYHSYEYPSPSPSVRPHAKYIEGSERFFVEQREPIPTGKVFIAAFDANTNFFHYKVWLRIFPDVGHFFVTRNAMIGVPSSREYWLSFTREIDYDQFCAWLNSYKQKFNGNIEDSCFPTLPQGHISGDVSDFCKRGTLDAVCEQFAWVVTNCHGRFWFFTEDKIIFEDAKDAVSFRLRWGGEK